MNKKRAYYGLDAPSVIKTCFYAFTGMSFLAGIVFLLAPAGGIKYFILFSCVITLISLLYPIVTIMAGSYFFKFKVRDELIDQIPWHGNESVLDVGCGHGLLLVAIAKKITIGKVLGIDIWNQEDQMANTRESALSNARIEGVLDKVEIVTADMRTMPFGNAQFDVVVSSWAIHNIAEKQERRKALQEIVRVLKPGGHIALADIQYTKEYYNVLSEEEFVNLHCIGPRYTFGNQTFILVGQKSRN